MSPRLPFVTPSAVEGSGHAALIYLRFHNNIPNSNTSFFLSEQKQTHCTKTTFYEPSLPSCHSEYTFVIPAPFYRPKLPFITPSAFCHPEPPFVTPSAVEGSGHAALQPLRICDKTLFLIPDFCPLSKKTETPTTIQNTNQSKTSLLSYLFCLSLAFFPPFF